LPHRQSFNSQHFQKENKNMPQTNWARLILGILIASIIMFFADGFFHERVVVADWMAVYNALGISPPPHSTASLVYFAIFELGRGILAMALYVMLRACWKPGPAAAALAGIVMWIAFSVTGPAQFIPLGFFSHALWIKVGAFHLVTSIIAAIAGAAVYKDARSKTA
jgi:hypothetical protein